MEEKITQTILDEGTYFKIHLSSPEFLRWIGIKTIRLKLSNLYLGTLLKVSPLLQQLKIEAKPDANMINTLLVGMQDNIKLQAKIISIAILNRPWRIKLFTGLLSKILIWNLDSKSMSQLLSLLIDKMQVQDFMSSIVSIGGFQIVKKETSLESDSGEKIAPGSLSGQS
jgi:hypothetical protein